MPYLLRSFWGGRREARLRVWLRWERAIADFANQGKVGEIGKLPAGFLRLAQREGEHAKEAKPMGMRGSCKRGEEFLPDGL
ncbi:hypothetical protein GOP47_0028616 [Adiantum capillus-veneris]|nr:hypothetical protein GOP47_0028616 [Adiantum capillus-veneris]